jgi:hypothetical protein
MGREASHEIRSQESIAAELPDNKTREASRFKVIHVEAFVTYLERAGVDCGNMNVNKLANFALAER